MEILIRAAAQIRMINKEYPKNERGRFAGLGADCKRFIGHTCLNYSMGLPLTIVSRSTDLVI
jgi:hypothetical protein